MLRTILLIMAVFCGQLSAEQAQAQSPEDPTKEETAQQIDIRSPALDSIKDSVEAIASNTAPQDNSQQRQEDINFTERDVNAQETMAKYTLLIYKVTAWGLFVGVVTILCLGWSIIQTKRAIRAAETANGIAREMGEAQVRAYVTFSEVRCSYAAQTESLTIHFSVTNHGQSPAKFAEVAAVANVHLSKKEGLEVKSSRIAYLPIGELASGQALKNKSLYLSQKGGLFTPIDGDLIGVIGAGVTLVFFGRDVFKKDITVPMMQRYNVEIPENKNTADRQFLTCSSVDYAGAQGVDMLREHRTQKLDMEWSDALERNEQEKKTGKT